MFDIFVYMAVYCILQKIMEDFIIYDSLCNIRRILRYYAASSA